MQIAVKSSKVKGEGWNAQLPLTNLSRYPVLWEVLQALSLFSPGFHLGQVQQSSECWMPLFIYLFFDPESCLLARRIWARIL